MKSIKKSIKIVIGRLIIKGLKGLKRIIIFKNNIKNENKDRWPKLQTIKL